MAFASSNLQNGSASSADGTGDALKDLARKLSLETAMNSVFWMCSGCSVQRERISGVSESGEECGVMRGKSREVPVGAPIQCRWIFIMSRHSFRIGESRPE